MCIWFKYNIYNIHIHIYIHILNQNQMKSNSNGIKCISTSGVFTCWNLAGLQCEPLLLMHKGKAGCIFRDCQGLPWLQGFTASFPDGKWCKISIWSNQNPKTSILDGKCTHPILLNNGSLGMVYGFRLATCQKAEIQHWWTALCSDLCDWFNHLADKGHLVAEGSHGTRWQGGVAG